MDCYMKRIAKVQEKMLQENYEYLILGPSSNMYYFTGFRMVADERLQLIIIPSSGAPTAVLPEMYKEKAEIVFNGRFPLTTWNDQQDPLELVKKALHEIRNGRIAVDDTLRSSNLIQVMTAVPGCSYAPASRIVDSLRMFKDEEEIKILAEAEALADKVMEKVQGVIRPGMREKELEFFIEKSFREIGADDISFKPMIASGPNSSSPHHISCDREFQAGDFIIVDCGCIVKGYCSDITRTFCLGKATDEMKKIYNAVREANEQAFSALFRRCSTEEVDKEARKIINDSGYGPHFTHRTGHGIGLDIHEAPYLVEGDREQILPGMVFSIEPGIYLPGKYGVRIEDIVAMTAEGPRCLSKYSKDLLEL